MKQIIKEKGKFAILLIAALWAATLVYMAGYNLGRKFYCEETQRRIEKLENDKIKIVRYFMYGEDPDAK